MIQSLSRISRGLAKWACRVCVISMRRMTFANKVNDLAPRAMASGAARGVNGFDLNHGMYASTACGMRIDHCTMDWLVHVIILISERAVGWNA